MPSLLKRRQLRRPVYSLSKQLARPDSTSHTDMDDVATHSDPEENGVEGVDGNDTAESDGEMMHKAAKLNGQSEVTYASDDYLENIEGVSLSIVEDNDLPPSSSVTDKDQSNDDKNIPKSPNKQDPIKEKTSPNAPKKDTQKETDAPKETPTLKTDEPKGVVINGEVEMDEKHPDVRSSEMDLDSILQNLQSVLPTSQSSNISPRSASRTSDGHPQTTDRPGALDLSAYIDSIVSDMNAFVNDPTLGENHVSDNTGGPSGYYPPPDGYYYDGYQDDPYYQAPDAIDSTVNLGRRSDSTPNLYHTLRPGRVAQPMQPYAFHSLRYPKRSGPRGEGVVFPTVTPDKKSVSFNDVVYSTHYRNSDNSLDTDARRGQPSDDDRARLLSHSEDPDRTDEKTAFLPFDRRRVGSNASSAQRVRDGLATQDTETELTDDAISIPSEDDLYTSGNDTETEDERKTSRRLQQEPWKPRKVRKLLKSRTALLLIAWFFMMLNLTIPWNIELLSAMGCFCGLELLLPGASLRGTRFTSLPSLWLPRPEILLAKGGGLLLGVIVGALGAGIGAGGRATGAESGGSSGGSGRGAGLEVGVILSLLLLALSLLGRPLCHTLLLMAAAHALEGFARGIAMIASHLLVRALWRGDKSFLVLQCLYIALAAGMSVTPPLTFIVFTHAPRMVSHTHAMFFQDWIEPVAEKFVSVDPGSNITVTEAVKLAENGYYDFLTTTETPGAPDDSLKQHIAMNLLQMALSVVPVILALILCAFSLYSCIGGCRNGIGKYRHKRRGRKLEALHAKISQSVSNDKVFPNLNGTPGKSTTTTVESETEKGKENGKAISNGNVHKESSCDENKANNNETKEPASKSEQPNDNKTEEQEPQVEHITHISKPKPKKLSLKKRDRPVVTKRDTRKTKEKSVDVKTKPLPPKQTWLLKDQSCSVGALLYVYVFFSMAAALEFVMIFCLFYYAVSGQLQLSAFHGILMLTLFLICFAFSRILALPLSHFLPPNAFVVGCLALSVISSIIFAVYGRYSGTIAWLFIAFLGACIGPILPGGFTWANIYLNLNAKSLGLAYGLMVFGMTMFGTLAAALIQYVGSDAVRWLVVAMCAFSLLIFLPTMSSIKSAKVLKFTSRTKADNIINDSKRTYI